MTNLLKALKAVEDQVRPFSQLQQYYRTHALHQWVTEHPALSTPILDELRNFEKYRDSENLMLTVGNGYVTINPQHMHFILLNVMAEHGATFVVRALRHLLRTEVASVTVRSLIWGVVANERIRFCPGFYLSPASPEETAGHFESAVAQFPAHLRTRTSFSILSTKIKVSPVVAEAKDLQTPRAAPSHDAYMVMRDIASALRLAGPSPTLLLQKWEDFDATELNAISPFKGTTGMIHESLPFTYDGPALITRQFGKMVKAYVGLPEEFKGKLERSLHRLNNSLLRRSTMDSALEAGIAIEMLLLPETLNTEIGYRLALRAGLLAGKSIAERGTIRARIKKLYDARSRAAHGSSKGHPGDKETVREGLEACASIIRELIARKTFPDWARLELRSESRRN